VSGRRPWFFVAAAVAVVAAVVLAFSELEQSTRGPGGPASSSFATAPRGAAADAELLRRFGWPVLQLRERPRDARLDPRVTLVLLEPGFLAPDDGATIARFVRSGGRLVAGGEPSGWLGNVIGRPPGWRSDSVATARARGLPSVGQVRTAGEGAWLSGPGVVRLSAHGRPVLLERRMGKGKILLLADPSPLQNRLRAAADNAALGVALAGERPVAFVESVHGYGTASGLAAIPDRWWWVFAGLCLAALVLVAARGRRFGPAEAPARQLPPARADFAEAVAAQLAAKRPRADAVEAARRIVRGRLGRALGSPGASDEELRARAAARGFTERDLQSLFGTGAGDDEVLALGRLLARAEQRWSL
jgi:hypothetical protein